MRRRLLGPVAFSLLGALSLACTLFEAEETGTPASSTSSSTSASADPTKASAVAPVAPAPTPTPSGAPAFDPRVTGTPALARYQSGAYGYLAVVTSVSGIGGSNVVYADSDSETLPAEALAPDSVGAGTTVEARIRAWPQFHPGRVLRRVGHAVLVHFDDGDERWTSVGLLRVPWAQVSRTAPVAPAAPDVPIPQPGARVLANYQQQGWYYAGVITEQRPGEVLVIYADGDSEWLPEAQVRPDTIDRGQTVHASLRNQGVLEARVTRRVGHAVELQQESGQKTWVALASVRTR